MSIALASVLGLFNCTALINRVERLLLRPYVILCIIKPVEIVERTLFMISYDDFQLSILHHYKVIRDTTCTL